MDKNVESILIIALPVTFPLRGPCIPNWRWCLKVFHVLFMVKKRCGNHVVVWAMPTRLTHGMHKSTLDFTTFRWLDLLSMSEILRTCYVFREVFIISKKDIHYCHDDNIVILVSRRQMHNKAQFGGWISRRFDNKNRRRRLRMGHHICIRPTNLVAMFLSKLFLY